VREHLDVLTNWYVRTQRDRFWAEDADAFDTLWTSLEQLTRVMAPLAPLVTEEVWRGLTGGRSVHLEDWPAPDGLVHDDALVAAMDEVRAVVSTALGLRKAAGVRVRQPLRTLTVAVDDPSALDPYVGLLTAELNVKAVDLVPADAGAAERFGITQRLAVNARAAGPRLGRGVQAVIKGAKAGAWRTDAQGGVVVTIEDGTDVPLEPAEYELTTVVASADDGAEPTAAAAVLAGGGFVVLDLALDDDLRAEGYARDVVRAVQDARKAAGLQVGDRIVLTLDVPGEHVAAVEAHRDFIGRETLAVAIEVAPAATLRVDVAAVEAGGYEA
jgi:isoleucyl-tRNA synthetase